jgi:hypothetical protein
MLLNTALRVAVIDDFSPIVVARIVGCIARSAWPDYRDCDSESYSQDIDLGVPLSRV